MRLKAAAALIALTLAAFAILSCDDAQPQPEAPTAPAVAVATMPASSPTAAADVAPTSAPSPTATVAPAPSPTSTVAPTTTPAPSPTASAPISRADAERIFQDALAAMDALSSYRLRMDMVLESENPMAGKIKVLSDWRYRPPGAAVGKGAIALGAQSPVESETVLIDGSRYEKDSGNPFYEDPNKGKWIRTDASAGSPDDYVWETLAKFQVYEAVGNERLDGVETVRLKASAYSDELEIALFSDASGLLDADIWIGANDGLIRRVSAASEPGVEARAEMSMAFSEFDVPVIVEAPKDYIEWNERESPDAPIIAKAETTVLASGWTRAHLPDYGFSVSTPPDWTIFDLESFSYDYGGETLPEEAARAIEDLTLAAATYYFVAPKLMALEAVSEGGEARVSILDVKIMDTLEGAALPEYVDERMEQTESGLVVDGAIERRTETLPAGEAERVEFAFRFSNEEGYFEFSDARYAQIQYFLIVESAAFILTFATTADNIETMRPAFEETARTVVIERRP